MKLFDFLFQPSKIEYIVIGILETNKEKQLIGLNIESIDILSANEQQMIYNICKKIRKPSRRKWLNYSLLPEIWKLYDEMALFPFLYIKNKYCTVAYPAIKTNNKMFEPNFNILNKSKDYIIRPLCKFDFNYPIINDDIIICSINNIDYTDEWYPLPYNNVNIQLVESYIITINQFKLYKLIK